MKNDLEKILVTEDELKEMNMRIGAQITNDYEGKQLVVVGILKGSVFFLTDLVRQIKLPIELDFMDASSYYDSSQSSGRVTISKDIKLDVEGKDILIVEDILDTGRTLNHVLNHLKEKGAASIKIAALLDKPARRLAPIKADYVGMDVPDEFVVGYGLDYNEAYRGLPYIASLKRSVYEK